MNSFRYDDDCTNGFADVTSNLGIDCCVAFRLVGGCCQFSFNGEVDFARLAIPRGDCDRNAIGTTNETSLTFAGGSQVQDDVT